MSGVCCCTYRQQPQRDGADELSDGDRAGHDASVVNARSGPMGWHSCFEAVCWESRNAMEVERVPRSWRSFEKAEVTSPAPDTRPPISDRGFFICCCH